MVNVFTLLGSLSLIGGGIGYFIFPPALSFAIKRFINLAQNGIVYPLYMNPPFAGTAKFYLFAITNPKEVLLGSKMKFKLKGPYVYKTFLERDNILFMDSEKRVKYDSHRKLFGDEEASADFDERMWLLNPILPGTLKTVKSMILDRVPFQRLTEPLVLNAVNALLDTYDERLISRTTPRALLDGRKVELLEMLTNLASRFGLASLLPPGPPQNVFGLAFVQNETIDQLEIFTGVGNSSKFADVTRWKGKQTVDVWRGRCSTIRGTNGELYKPFIDPTKAIRIFLSPLCRSLTLVPTSRDPITTDNGFTAWEFELNPKLYSGARNYSNNRCFCEDTRTYDCQYDGLMSMGPCFFDSPIYFARAHFKGADNRIKGTTDFETTITQRLPDKQSFYLDKTTGTVLGVNLTLMAIIKVVRQKNMRDLDKVQNLTYAPAFLVNETILLPLKFGWQIYMLQLLTDNYQLAFLATAGFGATTLALRMFIAR